MVVNSRRIATKNGRTMAIVELEDLTGSMELVAFPDTYERTSEIWVADAIVLVEAKLDRRGEALQLICEAATTELPVTPSAVPDSRRTLQIRLPMTADVWADIQIMHRLDAIFRRHEGDDLVVLRLPGPDRRDAWLRCRRRGLEWTPLLAAELTEALGPDRVTVVEGKVLELAS
jgi:DNA polymerase-3 subunit alpha